MSRKSKFEVPVEKTIGEVFSYENNLVKIECNFQSVKEIYLLQYNNTVSKMQLPEQPSTDLSFGHLRKISVNKSQDETNDFLVPHQIPP